MLKSDTDYDIKKEALDKYLELKEQNNIQNGILKRWREIIFQISYVHTDDNVGETKHFRKITSPGELTNDEVITNVKAFLTTLETNAAGEDRIRKGHISIPGFNCPQRPR